MEKRQKQYQNDLAAEKKQIEKERMNIAGEYTQLLNDL